AHAVAALGGHAVVPSPGGGAGGVEQLAPDAGGRAAGGVAGTGEDRAQGVRADAGVAGLELGDGLSPDDAQGARGDLDDVVGGHGGGAGGDGGRAPVKDVAVEVAGGVERAGQAIAAEV